jgi:hypothetical protein
LALVAFVVALGAGFVPGAVAQPLVGSDIGAVGRAGSSAVSGGTWTVMGAGADIWGTADAFHFASMSASGDLDLRVRIDRQTRTHGWARAGLMIRENLTPGSRHVSVFSTPDNGVLLQSRIAAGGVSTATTVRGVARPRWLRLTRVGDLFTAFRSTDGVPGRRSARGPSRCRAACRSAWRSPLARRPRAAP